MIPVHGGDGIAMMKGSILKHRIYRKMVRAAEFG